jgi:hypothetical protein
MNPSQLEAEATKILKKHGYGWDGRPLKRTKDERRQNHEQTLFERRIARNGFRGASRAAG